MQVEGPRSAASKHRQLIAAFIHGPIAIDALGNGQRWAGGPTAGNQPGMGRGLNPSNSGSSIGDSSCTTRKPFFPSATKAKASEETIPILRSLTSFIAPSALKDLIELRMLGLLHIDDDDPLLAGRDIGVGASDIHVARVFDAAPAAPLTGVG